MKSWVKYAILVVVINVVLISYLASDFLSAKSIIGASGYWALTWFVLTCAAWLAFAATNILSLKKVVNWLTDSGKLTGIKEKLSTEGARVKAWLDKDGL